MESSSPMRTKYYVSTANKSTKKIVKYIRK